MSYDISTEDKMRLYCKFGFANNSKFKFIGQSISFCSVLGKVKTISESNNPVVAVGKHLCGSATGKIKC